MQITPVDSEFNLFRITDAVPEHLADKILSTHWLQLPWQRQEGQERWPRRRIDQTALSWLPEWEQACQEIWPQIAQAVGYELVGYQGTAWWLDEPGFTCSMHTDGELPGSMHLTWIGADPGLGTSFYWYKNPDAVRHRFAMQANTGYVMINRPSAEGYRRLLWHDMMTPVPENSYRITSYSWITTKP